MNESFEEFCCKEGGQGRGAINGPFPFPGEKEPRVSFLARKS